jgi:probable HAF family extracellular repeat protein
MIFFGSGSAYGINDFGTIVGTTSSGHAFSYSAGVMTDLGGGGVAYSINNSGIVVGQSGFSAFSYSGGVTTYFGYHAAALGINDSGTIVGYNGVSPQDSVQAFSYSSGVMTYLGTAGLGGPAARGINNAGTIVGNNNESHAVSYSDGVMTDLSPYLASIGLTGYSEANAINDNGDIVGTGFTASGDRDVFLLTQIPEPSTGALLTLGFVGLALRTLRGRHNAPWLNLAASAPRR